MSETILKPKVKAKAKAKKPRLSLVTKSETLKKMFAELGRGVSFFGDDLWKKWFYDENRREELCVFFGQDVLLPNGDPNLQLLRKIFFENTDSAEIRRSVQLEYQTSFMFHLMQTVLMYLIKHKDTGIVVIESDRLIQACWHQLFNNSRVVSVGCSADIRIERAIARSASQGGNPSRHLHELVMCAQYSDDHFLELASAVNAIHVNNEKLSITDLRGIARQILQDLKIPA
jgi:dephospho-CoA kinase